MGKKRKKAPFDEMLPRPASNPFEDEDNKNRASSIFSAYGGDDIDLDYTKADAYIGPDVFPLLQSNVKGTEAPTPATERTSKPRRRSIGRDEICEYDVARHIIDSFQTGLFEGVPYIKVNGVDEVLDERLIAKIITQSLPSTELRQLSARSFSSVQIWLRSLMDNDEFVLTRPARVILFQNGAFDFVNGKQVTVKAREFFPVRIQANYRPDAECSTPVFNQFLEDSSGGDPQVKRLILAFLGFMISPHAPDRIFLLGPAAGSGKSVLGNLTRELLGIRKTCAISLQNFSKSFELAQIFGKSANFCMDISSAVLSDATVAVLKRLSGGDPETINAKYSMPFAYGNYAKLVFSCNEGGVRLKSPDSGFERRLVVVPFLHSVDPRKMDPDLLVELLQERDGIILHAIQALKELHWNSYNFPHCRSGERLKQEYMGVADISVRDFIEEICELSPEFRSWTAELYEQYVAHCRENERKPISRTAFGRRIHSIPGVKSRKFQENNSRGWGVEGLGIKS